VPPDSVLRMSTLGYLIMVSIASIGGYFCVRRVCAEKISFVQNESSRAAEQYGEVVLEASRLKKEIGRLNENLEQIMVLYEVTRQICQFLDTDQVVAHFREVVKKYLHVNECQFLRDTVVTPETADTVVVSIEINKSPVGCLVAKHVPLLQHERFHILSEQFALGVKRAFLYKKVQELAITDTLTGVFSRRYYLQRFSEEIERSKKFQHHFSCLMIDVDHFKEYNDRYGHLVGDAVLKEISKMVKETIRQIDLVGRLGGEEFSIILTETSSERAQLVAERIRQSIMGKNIHIYDEDLAMTVSIGIAAFPEDGTSCEVLLERADSALYKAKKAGRNCVVLYRQ
jgi:diguanylate cyclase (GGDEF)-like protein